jgi:hypothetical protein
MRKGEVNYDAPGYGREMVLGCHMAEFADGKVVAVQTLSRIDFEPSWFRSPAGTYKLHLVVYSVCDDGSLSQTHSNRWYTHYSHRLEVAKLLKVIREGQARVTI